MPRKTALSSALPVLRRRSNSGRTRLAPLSPERVKSDLARNAPRPVQAITGARSPLGGCRSSRRRSAFAFAAAGISLACRAPEDVCSGARDERRQLSLEPDERRIQCRLENSSPPSRSIREFSHGVPANGAVAPYVNAAFYKAETARSNRPRGLPAGRARRAAPRGSIRLDRRKV